MDSPIFNDEKVIYQAAVDLFKRHWQEYLIRSIGVSISSYRQINLFEPELDRENLNLTITVLKTNMATQLLCMLLH
ncbi:DinB/UmuC family translesion DNA polymerase [Salibacterium aidingense]|uniref:DinB/UmuC family translesion DNA polymerase n=1 Tax=Salibacterium aidingense TaxID=384933 RepID=UPI00047DFAD1